MSVKIKDSKLNIYNPATNEKLDSVQITSTEEFISILDDAKEAANKYNYSSFFLRINLISQFQTGIVKNIDKIINIICAETGKKEAEGLTEVFIVLEHMSYLMSNLYKSLGKQTRRVGILKTKKAWIEYEPIGIVGIIAPWNYPLILTISPLVEALLAGNCVVIKPSEHTPLTLQLLKKIWDDSTKRPELFKPIYGSSELGNKLVVSELTNMICFTGSTSVGKQIAQSCAEQFKPVILELGGKDPMIILDDANLDRAVDAALWGGLSNAGQTCISVENIYVQERVFTEVINKLKYKIQHIKSGVLDSEVGAISIKEGFEKIQSQINELKNNSDVEIVQGKTENGNFIAPTLIINPAIESDLCNKEIFGPLMTIHSFKEDTEAIFLSNRTGYGLSAYIFGHDKKRIKKIASKIKAGNITINDVLTHYGISDLPFGGIGLSGLGKVHGKEGLRAFSIQKSYLSNRILFNKEIWWFKHRDLFSKFLRKWIKWRY